MVIDARKRRHSLKKYTPLFPSCEYCTLSKIQRLVGIVRQVSCHRPVLFLGATRQIFYQRDVVMDCGDSASRFLVAQFLSFRAQRSIVWAKFDLADGNYFASRNCMDSQ